MSAQLRQSHAKVKILKMIKTNKHYIYKQTASYKLLDYKVISMRENEKERETEINK